MSTRIVVDPVTRIEGHLRIEAEIENGIIQDAFSSGTMVRGIEIIVQDRDPREVWAYVGRVCGVCTSIHSYVRCEPSRTLWVLLYLPMPRWYATLCKALS